MQENMEIRTLLEERKRLEMKIKNLMDVRFQQLNAIVERYSSEKDKIKPLRSAHTHLVTTASNLTKEARDVLRSELNAFNGILKDQKTRVKALDTILTPPVIPHDTSLEAQIAEGFSSFSAYFSGNPAKIAEKKIVDDSPKKIEALQSHIDYLRNLDHRIHKESNKFISKIAEPFGRAHNITTLLENTAIVEQKLVAIESSTQNIIGMLGEFEKIDNEIVNKNKFGILASQRDELKELADAKERLLKEKIVLDSLTNELNAELSTDIVLDSDYVDLDTKVLVINKKLETFNKGVVALERDAERAQKKTEKILEFAEGIVKQTLKLDATKKLVAVSEKNKELIIKANRINAKISSLNKDIKSIVGNTSNALDTVKNIHSLKQQIDETSKAIHGEVLVNFEKDRVGLIKIINEGTSTQIEDCSKIIADLQARLVTAENLISVNELKIENLESNLEQFSTNATQEFETLITNANKNSQTISDAYASNQRELTSLQLDITATQEKIDELSDNVTDMKRILTDSDKLSTSATSSEIFNKQYEVNLAMVTSLRDLAQKLDTLENSKPLVAKMVNWVGDVLHSWDKNIAKKFMSWCQENGFYESDTRIKARELLTNAAKSLEALQNAISKNENTDELLTDALENLNKVSLERNTATKILLGDTQSIKATYLSLLGEQLFKTELELKSLQNSLEGDENYGKFNTLATNESPTLNYLRMNGHANKVPALVEYKNEVWLYGRDANGNLNLTKSKHSELYKDLDFHKELPANRAAREAELLQNTGQDFSDLPYEKALSDQTPVKVSKAIYQDILSLNPHIQAQPLNIKLKSLQDKNASLAKDHQNAQQAVQDLDVQYAEFFQHNEEYVSEKTHQKAQQVIQNSGRQNADLLQENPIAIYQSDNPNASEITRHTIDKFSLKTDHTDDSGYSLLHLAVVNNDFEMLNFLQHKAEKRQLNWHRQLDLPNKKTGETPLLLAMGKDNLEMVKWLIDEGATVDPSALYYAAQKASPELVAQLTTSKVVGMPSKAARLGLSTQDEKVKSKQLMDEKNQIIERVMWYGLKIPGSQYKTKAPLHDKICNEGVLNQSQLKDFVNDLETKNEHGYTPLHLAVAYSAGSGQGYEGKRRSLAMVQFLYENGVDIDTTSSSEKGSNISAFNFRATAEQFRDQFADKKLKIERYKNSYLLTKGNLYYVTAKGEIELVKINDFKKFSGSEKLLFDERSRHHIALSRDEIETLITSNGGHKPRTTALGDIYEDAALHIAVRTGDIAVTQYLLNKNANPNIQNADGDTPLHLATRLGDVEATNYLLKKGADTMIKNTKGETVFQIAESSRNQAIQKLLPLPKTFFGDVGERVKETAQAAGYSAPLSQIEQKKPVTVDLMRNVNAGGVVRADKNMSFAQLRQKLKEAKLAEKGKNSAPDQDSSPSIPTSNGGSPRK